MQSVPNAPPACAVCAPAHRACPKTKCSLAPRSSYFGILSPETRFLTPHISILTSFSQGFQICCQKWSHSHPPPRIYTFSPRSLEFCTFSPSTLGFSPKLHPNSNFLNKIVLLHFQHAGKSPPPPVAAVVCRNLAGSSPELPDLVDFRRNVVPKRLLSFV